MINLIRLIVVSLLIYLLYKLFKGVFLSSGPKIGNASQREGVGKGEDLVEDPYCHRYLPMSQALKISINDQTVFFCSKKCCEQYKSEKDLKK